jgi:hypothetical protein
VFCTLGKCAWGGLVFGDGCPYKAKILCWILFCVVWIKAKALKNVK